MIAAVAKNGVIGVDNDLPWSLRDDMLHFMRTTKGHVVVMGRKTYESMGRPLPDRINVVMTRQEGWGDDADGLRVAGDVESAISKAIEEAGTRGLGETVYVIGGGAVYAACMPFADELIITHVDAEPDGHAHFPEIDAAEWSVRDSKLFEADDRNEHAFEIRWYDRVR
jgi:dihydrofolate reductase